MYPIVRSLQRGYIGVYRGIWVLGFRISGFLVKVLGFRV